MSDKSRTRVLYIAGYSRTGSTILDMVLNAHPAIASTGELTYLGDDSRNPALRCGCGEPYLACPIYGLWLGDRPKGEREAVRAIEKRAHFYSLLKGQEEEDKAERYRRYANELFDHLHEALGAEVIVDSSKTAHDAAGRPLALSKLGGLDVRVLHLTRDPRATMNSYLKAGSNWVLEGRRPPRPLDSWRPILGWALANRLAQQIGAALGPGRYLQMQFEAFQQDPVAALAAIGTLIELDLSDLARGVVSGELFSTGHSVGGNRTRLEPQQISLKRPPPQPLPMTHALCLRLVGNRLARELGYDIRR